MRHRATMRMLVLTCLLGNVGAGAGPVLSEFVACNKTSLLDADGDSSDWIEIQNPTTDAIDLEGWYLTDDLNDLRKWEFPEVGLGPDGYLVVFASGKDRRDPAGELHTNFALRAGGESVALVEPDGRTIACAYPNYPPQLVDISYGLSGGSAASEIATVLVPQGARARALIPRDNSLGLDWMKTGFNDRGWLTGTTGVGYDYAGLIGLAVAAMRGVNRTVYVRIPFTVADVASVDRLILRMRYEDGFVAYLNGVEVARANAPAGTHLAWNSGSLTTREDQDAVIAEEFDLTQSRNALAQGDNVLAIQGLNTSLTSSDLLILPELVGIHVQPLDLSTQIEGYLLHPTPGVANQAALAQVGPAIRNVTDHPPAPAPGEDLVISAEVAPTAAPVRSVTLFVRVGYASANRGLPTEGFAMHDDGRGADAVAQDGIYSAAIPSQFYGPGEMVCWYVTAEDAQGRASRDPLFPYPDNSPEYYGTVVRDPAIVSALPILYWFTEDPAAASTRAGARGSVFFDGEFYDNIFVRQRGGATIGAGSKKFVFNNGRKFRFSDDCPRVKEFNFNQNGSDPSYLRQPLAFETIRNTGCPSSLSFLMLSVRNGQVEGVRVFVEQVDEAFLERNGLDPHGALYKFVQRSSITPVFSDLNSGIEKKTREDEGLSDIRAVVQGLNVPTAEQRRIFVFDSFNLPEMLDYLAARCLLQDTDDIRKNFYFYCDTADSGEWSIFPWDKDWTFGVVGDGWIYTSHPFLGDQVHPKNNGLQWSVYLDVMYNLPETREMFLRRTRTVMDELLQAPGTPARQRLFENRIDELFAPARPHVGNLDAAVNSLKAYFATRRTRLYVDHNVNNRTNPPIGGNARIPDAQPQDATLAFGACDYNPVSGNQDEEYIELINPNSYAVDLSGWELVGSVEHTFAPGTVLIAGGRFYVSPSVRAFRGRAISPTGGEGRFVQGNYRGRLSSWGGTISLLDRTGRLVDTLTYAGTPSDQQRCLRITEIMYNPAPGGAFDNEEYEFIELQNVATASVDLAGVRLTRGISYAFSQARNTLSAGGRIVIARNRTAFLSRYSDPGIRLAPGVYTGRLDNGGETIELRDRTDETVLAFRYEDGWFENADGLGYSLTIKDPANANLDSWADPGAWQPSPRPGGSPGS